MSVLDDLGTSRARSRLLNDTLFPGPPRALIGRSESSEGPSFLAFLRSPLDDQVIASHKVLRVWREFFELIFMGLLISPLYAIIQLFAEGELAFNFFGLRT